MIIPTDEQVERACALVAESVNRAWPEDIDVHELFVWRAMCRTTLVIMLNRDAILGGAVEGR